MRIPQILLCTFLAGLHLLAVAKGEAQVAAASDLKFALDEIAATYTRETGENLQITYGSSGNFRQQISQGAPFQLFLSADESYVWALAKAGRTMDEGVLYATGRLVIFTPNGSPVKPDADLKSLARAIAEGKVQKFAIANPEHAPYGRAAREALISAGLWKQIQPLLVLGENVSQTAQFATSGSTQGGIFAYSLALSPAVAQQGSFVLIPETSHQLLKQRMVLLKGASPNVIAFYRFLQQPRARSVFKRFGFLLPGD